MVSLHRKTENRILTHTLKTGSKEAADRSAEALRHPKSKPSHSTGSGKAFSRRWSEPQRLKATRFCGSYGTTQVVPFPKSVSTTAVTFLVYRWVGLLGRRGCGRIQFC